MATHCRI